MFGRKEFKDLFEQIEKKIIIFQSTHSTLHSHFSFAFFLFFKTFLEYSMLMSGSQHVQPLLREKKWMVSTSLPPHLAMFVPVDILFQVFRKFWNILGKSSTN
jgi:hypothetical protein